MEMQVFRPIHGKGVLMNNPVQPRIIVLSIGLILMKNSIAAPIIYPTDIMGRDLQVQGIWWAGHVGIATALYVTMPATDVMEAMNAQPVIQVNKLLSFKTRSNYWGSRFGVVPRGSQDALQILRMGYIQKDLCPQYTYTPFYTPGLIGQRGYARRCSKFRCDTFINFIYGFNGYKLPTYDNINSLPRSLFLSFPRGNGDGPLARRLLPLRAIQHPSNTKTSLPVAFENSNTKTLNTLSIKTFRAIVDQFVNTPTVLQHEKILLQQAISSKLDSSKRAYLLDYIGSLGNGSEIYTLIEQYAKGTDQTTQKALLYTLQDLYQRNETIIKNNPSLQHTLHDFYQSLLSNSALSGEPAVLVLRGARTFMAAEELRTHEGNIHTLLSAMIPAIRLGMLIELAFKDPILEIIYLPEIINFLMQHHRPDFDETIEHAVVTRLGQLGINTLLPDSKARLETYFDSLHRRYMIDDTSASPATASIFGYGAHLETRALLSARTLSEAGHNVAEALRAFSPTKQARYIVGLSQAQYMQHAFKTEAVFSEFLHQHHRLQADTFDATSKMMVRAAKRWMLRQK